MFSTLQNTIKSSPKTLREKRSGPLSMPDWQGLLTGASPNLVMPIFHALLGSY